METTTRLHKSIRAKITWAQAVSILLTVTAIGLISHALVSASHRKLVQEKLEIIAFSHSRSVDRNVEDLKAMMQRVETLDYHRSNRPLPLSQHFSKFSEVLPSLSYLNAQGHEEVKVLRGKVSGELRSLQGTAAFQNAMKNPNRALVSISETDADLHDPTLVLTLARYGDVNNEFLGVLRAAIPLSTLCEQISTWPQGQKGKTILLDEAMRFLLPPDPKMLFAPLSSITDAGSPAMAGLQNRAAGFGEAILNSRSYLLAYAPMESTGWMLAALVPKEDADQLLTHLEKVNLAVSVAGLAFGVLLALSLTRPMVRNLRKIRTLTQALAQGRLDMGEEIKSGDEIQELADAVNTLRLNLSQANKTRDYLDLMLQTILDPLLLCDGEGVITKINRAACQLLMHTEDALLGCQLTTLFANTSPLAVPTSLAALLAKGEISNFETHILRSDGVQIPIQLSFARSPADSGESPMTVFTLRDITKQKEAETEIARLAYYDSLTGLPNRQLLLNRLEVALAQQTRLNVDTKSILAVLFLDLDHFKVVNDTLGHHVGDQLLQRASKRLQKSLRRSDTVSRPGEKPNLSFENGVSTLARLGGDEFVIILPNLRSAEDIPRVARRIIEDMARPFKLEQHEIFTPASIGIAVFPEDGQDCDTLLQHADIAMYHAKSQGRNSFHFYSSDMNAAARERLVVEHRLRQSIEKREGFSIRFQPKVSLSSPRVCGMEVLLRWNDATLGDVSPVRFIPIAEETGLIVPLGEWVLEMACEQTRQWLQGHGCALKVAVNLSGRQLRQPDLVDMVERVLHKTGLPPGLLELELTESMLMETVEDTIALMHRLKGLGIALAIDDFGTGYSSLSYLKRFPIDTLKIDRSFISELESEGQDAAIVRAIISMARTLNLAVVAEGVETQYQHDFLRTNDCDLFQGYLFSRPVTAAEFETAFITPPG